LLLSTAALASSLPSSMLRAATREDFLEVLGDMASALSGDVYSNLDAASKMQAAADLMRHIDRSFPDRDKFRRGIEALVATFEITSSVEIVKTDKESADVDWYMELKSRDSTGSSQRRRKIITVRMSGKKVTALSPVDFFAP
jgi:hypothetical protein